MSEHNERYLQRVVSHLRLVSTTPPTGTLVVEVHPSSKCPMRYLSYWENKHTGPVFRVYSLANEIRGASIVQETFLGDRESLETRYGSESGYPHTRIIEAANLLESFRPY